jgi:hypothetical protein
MNPVIELLYELYLKIFRFVFNILWWNPTVRKMGDELYFYRPIVNPIDMIKYFRSEVNWLKEHKASRWMWFDYICGCIRAVILILVLLTLCVAVVGTRGIR